MTWARLVLLVLATWGAVDCWRRGAIFATWRVYVEAAATEWELRGNWRYAWAAALDCTYCLTHHVTWVLLVLFLAPGWVWPSLAWLFELPLWWLAATRLATLLTSARGSDQD